MKSLSFFLFHLLEKAMGQPHRDVDYSVLNKDDGEKRCENGKNKKIKACEEKKNWNGRKRDLIGWHIVKMFGKLKYSQAK